MSEGHSVTSNGQQLMRAKRGGPKPKGRASEKKDLRVRLTKVAERTGVVLNEAELAIMRQLPSNAYIEVCKRWILLIKLGRFSSGRSNGLCLRDREMVGVEEIARRLGQKTHQWWLQNGKVCESSRGDLDQVTEPNEDVERTSRGRTGGRRGHHHQTHWNYARRANTTATPARSLEDQVMPATSASVQKSEFIYFNFKFREVALNFNAKYFKYLSSPSNGQGFRELRGPNVSHPTRPLLCGKDVQPIEGKAAASSDSDSQASEDSIEEILCDPIPENKAKSRLQSSGHPVKSTKSRLARPMTGRALYQATVADVTRAHPVAVRHTGASGI
ncbi:hypothetical protein FOZ61_000506 [Perkinsus olseni]|uniref:Uncharacterized protein n=1 Tax=Perkinsus olseni TaxID=32597 RepID=A0A7J6KUK9_PEROL|nr:hypothetical protein FOZ61_000506 [Perkinsus olseni]